MRSYQKKKNLSVVSEIYQKKLSVIFFRKSWFSPKPDGVSTFFQVCHVWYSCALIWWFFGDLGLTYHKVRDFFIFQPKFDLPSRKSEIFRFFNIKSTHGVRFWWSSDRKNPECMTHPYPKYIPHICLENTFSQGAIFLKVLFGHPYFP